MRPRSFTPEPHTRGLNLQPATPTDSSEQQVLQRRSVSIGNTGSNTDPVHAPSNAYPLDMLPFQPTYRATRSLYISHRRLSISRLRSEVNHFGDIQSVEQLDDGSLSVTFYDIRAAHTCCESLNRRYTSAPRRAASNPISAPQADAKQSWQFPSHPHFVCFFIEPRIEDANRGSLLICGQHSFVSAAEARRVCSQHGQTGFVWGPLPQANTPTPAHLVGFHDTRATQHAVQQLQGISLRGNLLLVERVPDPIPSYSWSASGYRGPAGTPFVAPVPTGLPSVAVSPRPSQSSIQPQADREQDRTQTLRGGPDSPLSSLPYRLQDLNLTGRPPAAALSPGMISSNPCSKSQFVQKAAQIQWQQKT